MLFLTHSTMLLVCFVVDPKREQQRQQAERTLYASIEPWSQQAQ